MTCSILQKNRNIKHKAIKIARQLKVEAEKNQLRNIRVLRATSGN